MTNEEKIEEILNCENCKKQLFIGNVKCPPTCADYNNLMKMAQWKDERVKQIQEREIKMCNNYIEKHPNNKLMLKYHLGRLSLCDELLGTDSKDKINMAFATMD